MNAFIKLASVVAIPLVLINGFGGIVSGIWLAILGEWGLIGTGIATLLVAGFALGFAIMPGMLLSAPAIMFLQKGNKLGFYVFGFLSTLYTMAVLTIWCTAVLYFFVERASIDSIIPVMLWSYGVAIGPIAWLAQKDLESGNEYGMISTFFAQVAYLLAIIAILFIQVSLFDVIVLFGIVMIVALVVQFRIAFEQEKGLPE